MRSCALLKARYRKKPPPPLRIRFGGNKGLSLTAWVPAYIHHRRAEEV